MSAIPALKPQDVRIPFGNSTDPAPPTITEKFRRVDQTVPCAMLIFPRKPPIGSVNAVGTELPFCGVQVVPSTIGPTAEKLRRVT